MKSLKSRGGKELDMIFAKTETNTGLVGQVVFANTSAPLYSHDSKGFGENSTQPSRRTSLIKLSEQAIL